MDRRTVRAALLDVAAVVVFVAIGRRSHDEDGNVVVGALKVAAPFVIALVVGWVVSRAWRRPDHLRTGVVIWLVTIVVGMLLRHFAFDRGTAASFIIVATIALGCPPAGVASRGAADRPSQLIEAVQFDRLRSCAGSWIAMRPRPNDSTPSASSCRSTRFAVGRVVPAIDARSSCLMGMSIGSTPHVVQGRQIGDAPDHALIGCDVQGIEHLA